MTIDQFVDQVIQHEDYMSKLFKNTGIGDDIDEAYEEALEVAKSVVYKSNWDSRKIQRMEDEDFIDAASNDFYETYASTLHDLWVDALLDEATDDAKQKFITYILRRSLR